MTMQKSIRFRRSAAVVLLLMLGTQSAMAGAADAEGSTPREARAATPVTGPGKGGQAYRELSTVMSEFSRSIAAFTRDLPPQYRLAAGTASPE